MGTPPDGRRKRPSGSGYSGEQGSVSSLAAGAVAGVGARAVAAVLVEDLFLCKKVSLSALGLLEALIESGGVQGKLTRGLARPRSFESRFRVRRTRGTASRAATHLVLSLSL